MLLKGEKVGNLYKLVGKTSSGETAMVSDAEQPQ